MTRPLLAATVSPLPRRQSEATAMRESDNVRIVSSTRSPTMETSNCANPFRLKFRNRDFTHSFICGSRFCRCQTPKAPGASKNVVELLIRRRAKNVEEPRCRLLRPVLGNKRAARPNCIRVVHIGAGGPIIRSGAQAAGLPRPAAPAPQVFAAPPAQSGALVHDLLQ